MWIDDQILNLPRAHWADAPSKQSDLIFRFFECKSHCVILANSNQAEIEVNVEQCALERVPILKRKGGGGTVVLGPGVVVLSLAFYAKSLFDNATYFANINDLWIKALRELGLADLATKGISDIAVGDKKIAGTSIFRRRHLLVYQGSLLVDPDLARIGRLLKHPSKEPDYREGRAHEAFLTTLKLQGLKLSAQEVADHCHRYFVQHASSSFANCILR